MGVRPVTAFDNLQPLAAAPTNALIADQILEGIMDGSIPAGSKLTEARLAERLGVSRGPIREALQRLVAQGVLVSHRGRGVFVATLEPEDVLDVYRCRAVTEAAAVRLIMAGGGQGLQDLEAAAEDLAVAARDGDWTRIARVDLQFHETLVAASGSKRLDRMFATLLVETRMCLMRLKPAYPVPAEIVPQHQDLVEAIRSGDEAAALALVHGHMRRAVVLQLGDDEVLFPAL